MLNNFVHDLKEFRYSVKRILKVMKDPESSSYLPAAERKSKLAMWSDNLKWFIKHGEANVFYFVYRLDRKGSNGSQLLAWNEFKKYRNTRNQKLPGRTYNYVCLLQDKFVFSQFLTSLGFPTTKNLAIFDKEVLTWLNNMNSVPLANLTEDSSLQIDGFVKQLSGSLGAGAFTMQIKNGKLSSKEVEWSLQDLRSKLDGQYLLQDKITQHPKMAELHPASVNTIRMVTFNNAGKIEVLSTVLRIGARGKSVDNWASGGIIVSINQQTGKLGKEGMFKIGYGGTVTKHPDTGVVLEGFQIPFFKESVELARKLHSYFYGIHSVGWDIAITPEGPIFIEGNDDWDGAIPMALDADFKSKYLKMFDKATKKGIK